MGTARTTRTRGRTRRFLWAALIGMTLLAASCRRDDPDTTPTEPTQDAATEPTDTSTPAPQPTETTAPAPLPTETTAPAAETGGGADAPDLDPDSEPVILDLGNVKPAVEPVGTLVDGAVDTPDGRRRTYHLYVPSDSGDGPMPLLIALHGGLGSGTQFREDSGFADLAEANRFLVVFPDGVPIAEGRDNRVWNGGGCCGVAARDRQNVDDVGFISAVIDEIEAVHPVDPSRVYAAGHSNGGIMAYRLACELSDRIVAVAFQSGTLEIGNCPMVQPVSLMSLHGLADTNIPIDGGRGSGVANYAFASPRESVETVARLDGCTGRVDMVDPTNPDVSGTRWTGCDGDTTVEMILVEGANHAWMGHRGSRFTRALIGEPYPDLDASVAIWSFLSRRTRPTGS